MERINLSTQAKHIGPQGTVLLGFGPQKIEWLSKVSELCGRDAVLDHDVARMAGATIAVGPPGALATLRKLLEIGALEVARQSAPGVSEAAAKWLASGERGVSSNAIFSHLTGVDASGTWGFDVPYDPADFRRCRLLLEQVPDLRPLLPGMRSVSPAWARLVDQWDEICAVMDEETPDWRKPTGQKAPRTYAKIKAAIGR